MAASTKFFLPNERRGKFEDSYAALATSVQSQLRLHISERRIHCLDYIHDKRRWHAEVGKLEEQQGEFEIVAIFESKLFIICTRAANGEPGVTILVNPEEVTACTDFAR